MPQVYEMDRGYPAAMTARPWLPPSMNLIGRPDPAFAEFSTGGLESGDRNPVKTQVIRTVVAAVAVRPSGSVTRTRMVGEEGADPAGALKVADAPAVSNDPLSSRSQA